MIILWAIMRRFVFGLFWCTTNSLTVSVGLFFIAISRDAADGCTIGGREQPAPRVQRTAGQKRPGGAFLGRGRVPNRVHHKQPYGKRGAVFLLLFCGKAQPSASSEMRTADVRGPPPTNVGQQNEEEYVEFAVHQLQSTFECAKITIISLKGAIVNEKWCWRGVDQ